MTTVTFYKRKGVYYGFHESGHTGYAEEGEDILCSALSAMTMLMINTIEISYAATVDYTYDAESADITFKVKSALPEYEKDEKKQFAISGLLQGYFMQLMDLTEEYYDFLTVEEVEDK